MDYRKLAEEFMRKMFLLSKERPQQKMHESMKGESFLLHFLAHHGSSSQPSELSSSMGISTARIAAALNSLERKGMITRRIDPSDRRRILVDLTEAGKAQAQEQQRELLEHTARFLSMLGEEDAKEYVRITGKLAELASKHPEHR
ncbi:MAG TPA: MarR family transcriptional regulator [Clostridia bacterium]|nr:MarR family transcriptional regulator [Clostridia bacterium]